MKILTLLTLLALLATPVIAGTPWTHKTIEGEDGGINGDYYFYQSFTPRSGANVMSVLKARVVYGYDLRTDTILVADYSFTDGLHVRVSLALSKDAKVLFSGDDVKMKVIRDYKVPFKLVRGQMVKPQQGTKLKDEQQADLFNLIHVLAMQRSIPTISEESAPNLKPRNSNLAPSGAK